MASHGKHQVMILLLIFLVASSIVEARESVFFSKVNPVRRYSQFITTSTPPLAPLASPVAAAPAPAPSSETEQASENYVYGFYNREVGEFPVATTKPDANAVQKTSGEDDFENNDTKFGTQDEDQRYNSYKYNNYEDEYKQVNEDPGFRRSYRSNNNVHNYKYTRSYDDNNMYRSNYNTEQDDNSDQYTDERYYTDKFERAKPRTISGNRYGRYYNDNGAGYYRENENANEYNSMEEYEGVYQP
ncbi:hypothetical protein QQ045_026559 [Rhodiola kirilowii]